MKTLLSTCIFVLTFCISLNILNAQPLTVRTVNDLNATASSLGGGMRYFSLKDSSIITGSDTASNKWDFAFRSTTIWVNGGTNRFGNGGAIIKSGTTFDAEILAPTTGYAVDGTPLAIPTGSGNGWYNYNGATNIIDPIEGRIFLIKTGDGKYAKIQILSYYQGGIPIPNPNATNSGYYKFKYVYQPDGSGNLNNTVGITNVSTEIPNKFKLSQNYPNPFNPVTNINFSIPKASNVSLKIYNALGKEVADLVNSSMNAGTYTVDFDAAALSSGMYFYKLITNDFTATKKMMLTK